jgi:hypothetical protein
VCHRENLGIPVGELADRQKMPGCRVDFACSLRSRTLQTMAKGDDAKSLSCQRGVAAIQQRLREVTSRLAGRIVEHGWQVLPADRRAGHILGARRPGGLVADFIPALARAGVHVSDRLGVLRISPHVWVDEADLDRVVVALDLR